MPDRFIETHIRQLPLFARLPPEQLTWIAESFRVMRFEPGELVFQQGQPTQGMHMVVTGRAQLIQTDAQGNRQSIGIVNANQYLNEIALYKPSIETASLHVLETSTLLFISRKNLLDVVSLHPEIKANLPIPFPAEQQVLQQQKKVFRGQRENESVLLETRRHWWAYASKAWMPVLVLLITLILSGFVPVAGVAIALNVFSFILASLLMLYFYLEWRNDHVIITDQRVIRIEQQILTFKTSISEIPLFSIQEVNVDNTSELLARVLNFGTIEMKTPGKAGNIILKGMPHPEIIQDIIFEHRDRVQQSKEHENRNIIRAEVDKVLGRDHTVATNPPSPQQPRPNTSLQNDARFSLLPTHFINHRGETVYRKHTVFWTRQVFVPGLALIGSVVFGCLGLTVLNGAGVIAPVFAFFLFLASLVWFYWADWDWRNDMYIIGDDTIQLIHKRPLWLQSETDQVLLSSVDNVVSEKGGLFQNLFDYGDVLISLIGGDSGGAKVFRGVPSPQEVQAEITRRQARLRSRKQEEDEQHRRQEIAEYLSVYHETVNTGGQPGNQFPAQGAPLPPERNQPPPGRPAPDRMRPPNIPKRRQD